MATLLLLTPLGTHLPEREGVSARAALHRPLGSSSVTLFRRPGDASATLLHSADALGKTISPSRLMMTLITVKRNFFVKNAAGECAEGKMDTFRAGVLVLPGPDTCARD